MLDILTNLFQGFATALTFQNLAAAGVGAVLGLVIGALPGMGSLTGVALLLPLTFKMNPTTAIIALAAIYYSNMYGGSFSAILLNIPGDSPAVMTTLDGYKLTKQGKAGKALMVSNWASFVAGTIGIVILTLLGPALANIGLAFGPAEMTMVILFAMTSIGWLLGESPVKGLLSTCIGILLATIGVDLAKGAMRYNFGSMYLLSGMPFIPLVIGMFGFSQVVDLMVMRKRKNEVYQGKLTIRDSWLTRAERRRIAPTVWRQGIFGTFIGILPGSGSTTAAFLSYVMEKRINKNRDQIGEGALEGVAAPEAANNAAAAGAFAPLLALGIPGSGTTAVLLGGLMMWGIQPGPMLFSDHPDFAWGLIASMYVGNIVCILISLAVIPFIIKILKIPAAVMIPVISTICVVGAYTNNNNMFDVWLMLAAGVAGWAFNRYKFPVAPLLLSFVLSPMFERSMRQAFDISNGHWSTFVTKPIAATMLGATVLVSLAPVLKAVLKKRKQPVAA